MFLRFFLLLSVSLPCFAQEPACCHRTISTGGTGEVRVQPDQIVVRMNIESKHHSAATAKRDVDQSLNRFLRALKPLGIADADIVAAALSIQPEYEYRDRQRLFSGYSASRPVAVTLRQLEHLDQLLDTAIDSGINEIMSLTPESSAAEQHRMRAHELAIEDSLAKARHLAAAYNAELGPVYRVDYQQASGPRPIVAESHKMLASADSSGGQYLQDLLVFSDSIQVVFDLVIAE